MNWQAGTYSTDKAREVTLEAIEFLQKQATGLRINNGPNFPFADLHEHYAAGISAYISLLEEGLKASRLSIAAYEKILKGD